MNARPPAPDSSPDDDALERLLRHPSATTSPLPDDGFTARVLSALPPPARQRAPLLSRRTALCLMGAFLGLALAWSQTPVSLAAWHDLLVATGPLTTHFYTWLLAPDQLINLGIAAAVLGALYVFDERRRSLL